MDKLMIAAGAPLFSLRQLPSKCKGRSAQGERCAGRPFGICASKRHFLRAAGRSL